MSQQNFKENNRNMSQPATFCRNKVQAVIKREIKLCHDKEFFCHNIAEEECEEVCRDTDQGKWQRNFVTTILTLSQHKRMKISR